MNQYLPPLSEWDEVKLFVALPLLSTALRNSSLDWEKLENTTMSTLISMVKDLAQFIVSSDHLAHSRSAAASCLFSILVKASDDNNDDEQTIRYLLEEVVSPVLVKALDYMNNEVCENLPRRAKNNAEESGDSLNSAFSKFEEALGLLSVVVC